MLRGHERATATGEANDRLAMRLRLESAIQLVIADILLNGPASRWSLLPSNGDLSVDGARVAVSVSSENGRLDLNEVDLPTLDTALRGFGLSARARDKITAALRAKRTQAQRLVGWADAIRVLAPATTEGGEELCIAHEVTIYSGLSKPDERFLSPDLARALGRASTSTGIGRIEPGIPVRIVAKLESGLALSAVVRLTGELVRPYDISRLDSLPDCLNPFGNR
jgi:general secretion pathway protein K